MFNVVVFVVVKKTSEGKKGLAFYKSLCFLFVIYLFISTIVRPVFFCSFINFVFGTFLQFAHCIVLVRERQRRK